MRMLFSKNKKIIIFIIAQFKQKKNSLNTAL